MPQNNKKTYRRLANTLILLLCLAPRLALPQAPTNAPCAMTWNFHQANIRDIIQLMAQSTGQHYIVDPSVHGNITIVARQPLQTEGNNQVFRSALRTLGYTTQTLGNTTRILPLAQAKQSVAALNDNVNTPTNQWLVQVVPIAHVPANQLTPILRGMLPDEAHLYAYGPSNQIILAGPSDEIQRMVQIIRRMDVDDNRRVDIVPLHHSDASRIAAIINQLQMANRNLGKSSTLTIAADTSSNTILLSGPPEEKRHYRAVLSQLDSPRSHNSQGNTEVIYLNYLKAKDLAPILTHIANNQIQSLGQQRGNTQPAHVSIQAENNTNAVIISAPPNILHALQAIVAQLDIKPIQVAVEAIIAQVDEDTSNHLGITWGNNEQQNSDTTSGNGAPTLGLGFQAGIGVIHHGSLQAVIHALRGNSTTDVLSTPSIVVLDNQKAMLSVGKDVAVDNRTYALSNSNAESYTPFTNTEYKKVALSLSVTPQISPDGGVRLGIKQTNDTLQHPSDPGRRPVINTSQIDTTVMVNNGDILVLGGLISHDVEESMSKIPILGDIPIIRPLFRYKKTSVVKKNLMVFLKPVLLLDDHTSVKLTHNKYDWIMAQQWRHQHGQGLIIPGEKPQLHHLPTQRLALPAPFPSHD